MSWWDGNYWHEGTWGLLSTPWMIQDNLDWRAMVVQLWPQRRPSPAKLSTFPLKEFPMESDFSFYLSLSKAHDPSKIAPSCDFSPSPVICKSVYFLWSESNSYFPTTLVFSMPSAILSSPLEYFLYSLLKLLILMEQHMSELLTHMYFISHLKEPCFLFLPSSHSSQFFSDLQVHLSLSLSLPFPLFLSSIFYFFTCLIFFVLTRSSNDRT